jgi:DNA-binding MarR family transcriptional regulator
MAEDSVFDLHTDPPAPRIVTALSKIGIALKVGSARPGEGSVVTPAAAQALTLLQRKGGMRRDDLSKALGLTPAAADELVDGLLRQGLASPARSGRDAGGRSVRAVRATDLGRGVTEAMVAWPDLMVEAIEILEPEEQRGFLVGLLKIIRQLQEQRQIPVARMCVTCRFFRPNAHDDPALPHHCAFVDAPFGDASLRVDCPDQEAAEPRLAALNWNRFVGRSEN